MFVISLAFLIELVIALSYLFETVQELLALEDRIGNVNTGLSEDAITRCLTETIYCLSDQIQDDGEEDNCPICLVNFFFVKKFYT